MIEFPEDISEERKREILEERIHMGVRSLYDYLDALAELSTKEFCSTCESFEGRRIAIHVYLAESFTPRDEIVIR